MGLIRTRPKGEASGGGGIRHEGSDIGSRQSLLPHGVSTEVEASELLAAVSAVATEGDELAGTDEGDERMAGGIEEGELSDFAGNES